MGKRTPTISHSCHLCCLQIACFLNPTPGKHSTTWNPGLTPWGLIMSDLCNVDHVSVQQDKNSRGHLSCHGKKLSMVSPSVSYTCYKHPWCCFPDWETLLCCAGTTGSASPASVITWDRVFISQLLHSNSSLWQITQKPFVSTSEILPLHLETWIFDIVFWEK